MRKLYQNPLKQSLFTASGNKQSLFKLRANLLGINSEAVDALLFLIPDSSLTLQALDSLDFNEQDRFILNNYNKLVPVFNYTNGYQVLEEISQEASYSHYVDRRLKSFVHKEEIQKYLAKRYPQRKDSISLLRSRWNTNGETLHTLQYVAELYGISKAAVNLKEGRYLTTMRSIPYESLEEKLSFINKYVSQY